MPRTSNRAVLLLVMLFAPALASAQIDFEKNSYYVAMGDSVAAGEGAMPVTHGYVYQLYDQGAFGPRQETDFASIAVRGTQLGPARSSGAAGALRRACPASDGGHHHGRGQ